MAQVYPFANTAAARHVDTRKEIRHQNTMVEVRARSNLAECNDTTRITAKDYFPAEIETADDGENCYTILHAPNAMALEFGHSPSGWFAGTDTKPPSATYILTRAAHSGSTIS